jgi:DnaJ-class molecular chaperone
MSAKESKSDWIEDKCPVCDGTGTDKTKAHAPGGVSAASCQACGGDGRKKPKKSN